MPFSDMPPDMPPTATLNIAVGLRNAWTETAHVESDWEVAAGFTAREIVLAEYEDGRNAV